MWPRPQRSGMQVDVVRQRRIGRLHDPGRDIADLVAPHQRDCLRLQNGDAVSAPAVHQRAHEPQVVGRGGVDAAAAGKMRRVGGKLQRLRDKKAVRNVGVEISRGSPTLTPPSAIDSSRMYTKAVPLAERPVTASICFSSTTTTRPTIQHEPERRRREQDDQNRDNGRQRNEHSATGPRAPHGQVLSAPG